MDLCKWPDGISRIMQPAGTLVNLRTAPPAAVAVWMDRERRRRLGRHQRLGSFLSKTLTDVIFQNTADYTALSAFTTEASLLSGGSGRRAIPANHFQYGLATTIMVEAWGVLGTLTATTPTYIFTVRLGTSSTWSASDTAVAASTTCATNTAGGVANAHWYLQANISCDSFGVGTGQTTLRCNGFVKSPGGFAAPYEYALAPAIASPGTWTTTIDGSLNQFIGLSVACSASSSSNTITCKRFMLTGRN